MRGNPFHRTAGYADSSYQPPKQCAQVYTTGIGDVPRSEEKGEISRYTGSLIVHESACDHPDDPARSYPQLVAAYGFLPNLFRVQSAIPHAIEAEQRLIDTIIVRQGRLSRNQKDAILSGVASVRGSDYCRALFGHSLAAVPDHSSALLRLLPQTCKTWPLGLGERPSDIKSSGFDERAILEAIVTTG